MKISYLKVMHHSIAVAILLICALMVASLHVVQHDWDDSGTGPTGHQQCQLSQLSNALSAHLPLILELPSPSLQFIYVTLQFVYTAPRSAWKARAPPTSV